MSDHSALLDALRQGRDAFQLMSEGIVFADRHGRIVFANTAAALLSGSTSRELEGTEGLTLLSAAEEFGVDVRRVPRFALDGSDDGWIAVLRAMAPDEGDTAAVEPQALDDDAMLNLVAQLRLGTDLDETIELLCEAISELPDLDGAMILMLPPSGDVIYKAQAGRVRVGYKKDQRLPLKSTEAMIDMTLAGPWVISTNSATAWRLFGPFALGMRLSGIRASAYVGLRTGGKLLGVLCVASRSRNGLALLQGRLNLIAQAAGLASTMLSSQAAEFGRLEDLREDVRACIDERQFHSVYQPIIRLCDGSVFAYEALTRFDDGAAPETHFLNAHLVGFGREMEEAAAQLALNSCSSFPADTTIAMNFSPAVLTQLVGSDLLQHPAHPLIVEITEHSQIQDYQALLAALAEVPHLPLAVDDAGAGFASLRHIIELDPKFVKLDIGLIRDLHRDPARAALVAGMCHFARTTGTILIAEGVECVEEADALRTLGVELAQGYYFACPAPAADFVA